MMIWKDEYCIGNELIDAQHQYLFEIGNNAYKLLKNDNCDTKYNDVALIIQDLIQYTKFHFQTEEEYMLKINYKEYVNQKEDHDYFIQQIDKINLDQVAEEPQKYIEEILIFIFNWLLQHILMKDMRIKAD